MAGIYKVIVGEKALFEINKKLNGSEKIRFNGAFAHTRKFNIELISLIEELNITEKC